MDSYSDYDQAFTSSVKSSKTSYTSPKQTRTVAYETDLKEIDQYLQYNSDFYDLQNDNSRVKTTYTSPKQTKTIVYETDLRENDQHVHYKTGSDRVNADLRSENDRLSSKLSEKMRIIEEWKRKYSELEANNSNVETLYAENANLNVEIHRLKDELSRVRSGESDLHKLKTHIEIISREKNELHVLLSEKENIIVQLRNDLEAAKGMRRRVETNEYNFESSRIALIEKDNVISELRLKLSRLEEQVLSVNEWKTKSLSIAAENQRLIRALEERGKEIEMMRTRNSSVERVNVVNVVSVQEKKLEAMLSEKTKEIEALRVRLSEKERERVVMSPVKSEYQEKYVLISSENEKLNAVICAKQKEIEALTVKLNQHHELEAKLKLLIQEKNKLVIERDSVVQERMRLESRLIEKDHAYDVLRVKVREAERPSQEFVELKQRLAIVLSENERLEAFIAQKKKEIEVLNARSLEYHDLELKLKLSIEKNNEIVVQKENAVEEKKRLEGFIAEITEEYEALSLKFRETEKIYSEIADLKSQLSVTISENERLSVLVIEREKELKCLESEIIQYKTSIEEYKQTIEHNKRVIEDGKRVIVEKEREFESHKTSHVVKSKTIESHENVVRHQVSSPVVVVKQESHVMSSEVARLEREIHMREAQVRQLEQRVALLLIQNKQLMQEREIIDTTFSCEVKELESLRLRSSELSIMNMQLKMYEEEKEETLKLMDKDRRLFEKSLYEKELVIKDLQAKSIAHVQRVAYFSELKARLARITNENERLVIEVQEKSREIETLRTEIHQLNVRNSTRVMVQETHTSEILLTDKIREINSLKARIVELEKGSYLADELTEKLRLSSTKYESIISSLNLRLSEMEALRVRCTQLSDIETKLTLVMRERDEAVNYERLNRNELASYQERIVRLEAQIVELNSYKQHNISSPKIVHIETNKTFEKEAELNLCRQEIARYQEKVIKLEAQITELSTLKQHQVQILNTPSKVVHVETKNVEKENELSKVIIQLKEKLEVASKEIERLNAVVSQKETQIVSLKKVESSKNTETLVLVQREKEELIKEKKRLSVMCEEYEREIEVLRLNVREIEVFGIEKQRLLEIINTKTREIQMLEQTLAVFESEKLSLKQIACEKEKVIEEMELQLFAKNSVNELRMNHQVSFGGSEAKRQLKNSATEKTLKSKLSYMSGFNDDFESILIEREQLEAQVAEKQKNIKELQIKVASAEKELVGSGELKSKVTLLDSESKRLNNVAMERLTKLNASEQQLRESTKEKSLLGIEVSEKKIEVNLLRSKVSDLEVKAKLVTELQGKLAMMVLENDRLTKDLDEKNQFITDLKNKYATLEGLYLLVRGNMKKPEAVEKKYQDMIGAIEQVEHKLGLYGRSKAMKKTISVQSILQMDAGQSQSYSLNVSPLSESKMMVESKAFSVTTKSTPTIQVQKAMF